MENKDFNQIYNEYKEQSQDKRNWKPTHHNQEKIKSLLSVKMMMAI